MSAPSREELAALLRGRDVLAAARALDRGPRVVRYRRGGLTLDRDCDGENERPVIDHVRAHTAGRATEAVLTYGAGVEPEAAAERLLALAELATRTGLLRAVCPIPSEDSPARPGSWGVEDLGAILAARLALPEATAVRPDWERLGPGACQLAVAFGADEWLLPAGDTTDPVLLAEAVGARAEPR